MPEGAGGERNVSYPGRCGSGNIVRTFSSSSSHFVRRSPISGNVHDFILPSDELESVRAANESDISGDVAI